MSAEETELTFIRCPSCRSLVPAVATRCRMCGHQFEKKATEAAVESSSITEQKEALENSARPRVRQKTMSASSEQIAEIKEQLRTNLEKPSFVPKEEEIESVEELVEEVESEKSSDDEQIFTDKETFDYIPPKRGNFSFEEKSSSRFAAVVEESKPVVPEVQEKAVEDESIYSKKVNMEPKSEVQFKDFMSSSNGIKDETMTTTRNVEVTAEGNLLGWLVAFGNDSRGNATEVRSGKFFIGRQKLRSADMLVPDSSVSTPHCMVTATPEVGLLVQDLMSEKGTFYRKANSQKYVQVTNVVELGHGDWLKFGEYEVMVCLVPYDKNSKK